MDSEKKESAALDEAALEGVSGGVTDDGKTVYKKIRCPGCGNVFTAPVSAGAIADAYTICQSCGIFFSVAENLAD